MSHSGDPVESLLPGQDKFNCGGARTVGTIVPFATGLPKAGSF
jgi:hypothetical protein